MLVTSLPLQSLAADPQGNYKYNYDDLTKDKAKIINENKLEVKPVKADSTADVIKNPDQPAIYTLRTDYKVQRGEKYQVDYQPYIASVGEAATKAEKDKVKKTIDLPALAGYDEPQDNFTINYETVKKAADGKGQTGDKTNGIRYQANEDFRYKAKANKIKIKHVFQDLEDFTKYTNPDGSVGEKGELITTQQGNTGSTMEVSPLDKNDPRVKGFVPEADSITMQVPENAENFILEYRYNRAHYDVVFDTAGGTELPARTLYTGQVIPKIADESIPTKVGGEFQGWKPSVDLKTKDGKTYKANEIITVATSEPSKNLDANLIMPPSKVTFTAEWKDREKADYAVQFWAEKADHADGAGLEKYDYIGTRVYKDQNTGDRPDLDNVSVKDIVFPDLDKARLAKIWKGDRFNRGKDLYLNKFYVYNQALTHDQNKDPENVNLVKSVDSTGKTVYNIYYDRQVYELYFTKSNIENSFYPEIWGYDEDNNPVKLGGPGASYHYKARFNQLMTGWPNDAMQTKGFDEGKQSFGWGPNYTKPNWPLHLDTPPYRLNADEFLDMENYDNWGGYVKHIDKGDGTTIDLDTFDFTTLSFGIKQAEGSMPHHMDFWMDGFKPGETIIRYDLYRSKADTNSDTYAPRYPKVQGFTPYGYTPGGPWPTIVEGNQENGRVDGDGLDELNAERAAVTPFPTKTYTVFGGELPLGKMKFISAFFNNADEFGDPDGWDGFDTNGYLRFKYTRNKYPLRFNYDPSIIRDDSYFKSTNQLDTFYEFPLKALSPDVDTKESYNTDKPANLLDNPEKLKELKLTDLVFTDPKDGKLKVKRPDNLSDQMVFKGWALDPAGTKLVWENPGEIMPNHAVNLYAKWGEPDYQWKVTFDPNGGNLRNIKEENITTSRKKIQEGDIGQEEVNTYAKKEANDGDKQVFTVIQRQKLVEPKKPTRKGYDFMGWEVIRYKKNQKGDYTDEIDTSYKDTYKVPELYSFGNDVVAPVYLKAIWVPNNRVDIDVEHYFLDKDFNLDKKINQNPEPDKLEDKRANYFVATTGDRQDDKYILATHEELEAHKDTSDVYGIYKDYNDRVKGDNTFFQQFKVEPAQKLNTETNKLEDNPDVKNNVFKFFYKPFRTREYKVNYIDERFKGNETAEGAAIVDQELVSNGNRHFDARNYRPIPGWVLAKGEKPQQQLFFNVNEKTNEFLGINGTGKDEITFYYKDVRVIEVDGKKEPPKGYVRVTFKAEKGGAFTDKDGKSVTELNYDVIEGLKSDLLPVPKELAEGEEKVADKYYITPETGKKFIKWDKAPLLNKDTIINEAHTFTAYFEWSGLSASGLVKTEAFKDPNGTWTNNFAPTIDQLKAQLVWREKDEVKDLPAGTEIKLYDESGNELTKDDQVFALVNEKKAADKDELVRTVNIKAKVTFKDGKEPQELDIPITVYKNVYEALNKAGDKPLFLTEAENKEAKDGGLKDILKDNTESRYIKVTIKPNKDFTNKDDKVYYVNPNAWVEIPELKVEDPEAAGTGFINWTADIIGQNDDGKANGNFDFGKRHKFTKDTVITPVDVKDVVEQTDPNKKPDVPNGYVKVIVKTTDNATDATAFEKTFWVNPTKEVTIPVTDPTGKEKQKVTLEGLGEKEVTYVFKEWQKVQTGEADDNLTKVDPAVKIDLAKNQYTDKVTVIEAAYKKSIQAEPIVKPLKTTKLDTPKGKEITNDDLIKQITPQEGKEIESIEVISKPDGNTVGNEPAKVIVKYKDGTTQGTNDDPVVIPVEVHDNIIPAGPNGEKPEKALKNYVKVIFKAGEGGTVSGDTVYYVSPEVEVNMTESAGKVTKTPSIGYYVNGEQWTNKDSKALKGTFTDTKTEFIFKFDKSEDIVEKSNDPNQVIPAGYVKVTFKTDGNGKVSGSDEKIYYVNPTAGITLKVLGKNETATDKQLAVPTPTANTNFTFTGKWQEAIDETTPITSERVHVAIFEAGKVTLTYKAGEGATGDVPSVVTVNVGETVGLANKGNLAKQNATFTGWKLDGEDKIYQPGDQVKLDGSRTATAQWKSVEHTVTFNSKGGSDIPSQKVVHGETLKAFDSPTQKDKVFMGWKEKDKESQQDPYFDLNSAIEENKTLIAQWQDPVQKIGENDKVEEQFIKVTFLKGEHGTLKEGKTEGIEKVTYKVAKDYDFAQAKANGLVVPGIDPAKYYKAKDANEGWDKTLDLTLEEGKTEKVFTAQYEPKANVIPVDPKVTDETQIKKEKPDGMVLVEFKVPENKAFMIGETKFYVKKNTKVDIKPPLVRRLELGNGVRNDYVFKGWNLTQLGNEWKFKEDTTIEDGAKVKPSITIVIPRAGDPEVSVDSMTKGAKAYLEVTRKGKDPVIIEAVKDDDYDMYFFDIPGALGGKLNKRDKIKVYAELDGIRSDTREYRVK